MILGPDGQKMSNSTRLQDVLLGFYEEEKQRKRAEIAERYQNESKLVKMVGGKKMHERKMEEEAVVIREFDYASDQLDEKIEEEKDTLIENFPLPDGKVDLMDLLAMAVSKAKDNSIWSRTLLYESLVSF